MGSLLIRLLTYLPVQRHSTTQDTVHLCCSRTVSAPMQWPAACVQGHSNTVEDVVFQPGSAAELASVADDSALLLWDTRSGTAPVLRVADAHGTGEGGPLDLHVVDWNPLRPELLATGGMHRVLGLYCRIASSPQICRRPFTFADANTHRSCQLKVVVVGQCYGQLDL